jgi:Mn2+/Fe2+ NRAMP family transporter
MRTNYPPWLLIVFVSLVLFANVFNIGADVAAMGSALQLIIGGPSLLYSFLFGLVSTLLIVWIPYTSYVSYLKWLTLVLLAYILTALVVHVPWGEALRSTVIPTLTFNLNSLTALTAVLGTTISPYLFIWQSSQEAEEVRVRSTEHALKQAPGQAPKQLRRIRWDTYFGMAVSNIVSYFIIMATAATLNASGTHNIDTAAQAAEALRPIAGPLAFAVFALGIIGTGLLALPVLAGSSAYALGEVFGWHVGLAHKPHRAKAFYGAIAVSTLVGIGLNLGAIDPIKALFWSAVINGIVAVPVMALMMHLSSHRAAMGDFRLHAGLKVMGWAATAVMAAAAIGLFLTWNAG